MKRRINEKKPIFKLTKEQFEKRAFHDKKHQLVTIGNKLKNEYGIMFVIAYNEKVDEVMLESNNYSPYNLNAIERLEKLNVSI